MSTQNLSRMNSKLTATLSLILPLLVGQAVPAAAADAKPPREAATPYGEGSDVYGTSSGLVARDGLVLMTWPQRAGKRDRVLASIDVRDPAHPVLLDRLTLPAFPQDIALAGSHVLVVDGLDLLIVDAADPQTLRSVARLPLTSQPVQGPQGLDVRGDIAFAACRRGGVIAVDVSQPDAPRTLGSLALPGFARDVTVGNDNLLYIAGDTRGLFTVDATDPAAMKLLDRMQAPMGSVTHVAVHGAHAFAAAGDVLAIGISLTNPEAPVWLASTRDRHLLTPYYGSFAHDVALAADADPADAPDHLFVADGEGGLQVVDISDPASPAYFASLFAESVTERIGLITAIEITGHHAWLSDQSFGLRVVDIREPAAPRLIGGLKLSE